MDELVDFCLSIMASIPIKIGWNSPLCFSNTAVTSSTQTLLGLNDRLEQHSIQTILVLRESLADMWFSLRKQTYGPPPFWFQIHVLAGLHISLSLRYTYLFIHLSPPFPLCPNIIKDPSALKKKNSMQVPRHLDCTRVKPLADALTGDDRIKSITVAELLPGSFSLLVLFLVWCLHSVVARP